MVSSRKPTEEQQNFFSENDLRCPRTYETARALIGYIDTEREGTREARMEEVREEQERWIGKRVVHCVAGDNPGVVRHLSARSPQAMRRARDEASMLRRKGFDATPSRFVAVVELDHGKRVVTLGIETLRLR